MPFARFTKVIINHFLKQHNSFSNLKYQHYHTIKDDGIVSRLKFVRIGEDYQEYGLVIPDVMLNDKVIQSESYQMFLKYFIEQEAADVMQALKESKKTSKRLSGTRGSSKGTGKIPGVPDESTVVFAASSEGTENEYSEEDLSKEEEIDWIDTKEDDEKTNDIDDDKSINLEMTDDEETDDEVLQGKEQVNDDEDEEMLNAEVEDSRKGNAEVFDVAKADAEKIEEAKDESKKVELPPTSSSLSIGLLLDIKIQYEVPHIQSPSVLKVHVSVIFEPLLLTPVQETYSVAPVTTLPPLSVSTIPHLRVIKLEKDVSELKKIDHSTKALATLKSQVLMVVEQYLGSKIAPESSKIQTTTINLEQESKKSVLEILKIKKEQPEKKKMPKYTIKSTDKKIPSAHHRLYHALMEALIEDENAMDKGVANTVKDHKRKHDDDDDEDPPAGPKYGKNTKRRRTKESESSKKPSSTKETPKGKASSKVSKTSKSASIKESVEEPIAEVVMDDAGKDVVQDDDQLQYTSEPKTAKTPNLFLFKQPPRHPTPDLEWNKHQVVFSQPKQP
ncbi:hypothetical protein Tco_0947387, partial [Tanacetum coccineum]